VKILCRLHLWTYQAELLLQKSWICIQIVFIYFSSLITGFVTRLTRRVLLVEQGLPTLPEHPSSPPVFSEARVTRSLVLCVRFVGRCSSLCTFSFAYCVICPSSIFGFLFFLWYLQTTPVTWVGSSYFTSDTHHATVKQHEYYTIINLVSQRKIMSPEVFIISRTAHSGHWSRNCPLRSLE
jgi:hypothetical protein